MTVLHRTGSFSDYIPSWPEKWIVMLCIKHRTFLYHHDSFSFLQILLILQISPLFNSGSGSRSRLMWNDGQYLVFQHIADLFYSDQEFALHTLPKLTLDHIVLTSFSKMKVKLAVQVLSRPLLWEKVVKRMSLVQPSSVKWWMDSLTVPMWGHWPSTSEKRIHSSCHMNLQKMSTWHSKMKDVFLKYLETWKAGNRAH